MCLFDLHEGSGPHSVCNLQRVTKLSLHSTPIPLTASCVMLMYSGRQKMTKISQRKLLCESTEVIVGEAGDDVRKPK